LRQIYYKVAFLYTKKGGHHTHGFRSPTGRDRCKGEFGTAVAAQEEDLPAAIARLRGAPKPDAVALSLAVRARFGPVQHSVREWAGHSTGS
jgi:hypothetical protein